MIMNIIVLVLVLSIGYAWMVRGVFNAMIHALCAFIAGAVAFAFWEPLALMLVKASPERGFFSFIEGIAWGAALIVPFAVVFLLLRIASDKLIPNNIRNNSAVDYAGGAVFGLVTGVISVGILVIGVGNMRLPTNFLGYQPLWYSPDRAIGAGALVKNDKLWVPVDSIVAKVYGNLSEGTMSSAQPLEYWYPELQLTGFASRVSPEGAGRNTLRPKDFNVKGVYSVGPDSGEQVKDLLKYDGNSSQAYVNIDEESVGSAQLYGYVIEFEPGAKERGKKGAGQLIVSNGQVRLLVADSDGKTHTIFPVAVISESSEPGQFGRWRFDGNDVFISSTGGASKIPMAFEFVVPQGDSPVALFVKNIRVNTDELPKARNFESVTKRDRVVRTGSILEGKGETAKSYNDDNAITVSSQGEGSGVTVGVRLMDVLASSVARRGMTLDSNNEIVGGQGTFLTKEEVGRKNAPTSKKLRVDRYAVNDDQAMVKLDVGVDSRFGFLSKAMRTVPLDKPIVLLDTRGNEYEAIGYEYQDEKNTEYRFTLGASITGIQDTPSLSTSRTDQKLNLLFVVTKGVEIDRLVIGEDLVVRFDPPIDTSR